MATLTWITTTNGQWDQSKNWSGSNKPPTSSDVALIEQIGTNTANYKNHRHQRRQSCQT